MITLRFGMGDARADVLIRTGRGRKLKQPSLCGSHRGLPLNCQFQTTSVRIVQRSALSESQQEVAMRLMTPASICFLRRSSLQLRRLCGATTHKNLEIQTTRRLSTAAPRSRTEIRSDLLPNPEVSIYPKPRRSLAHARSRCRSGMCTRAPLSALLCVCGRSLCGDLIGR